jgi:uncharacterized membrane protein
MPQLPFIIFITHAFAVATLITPAQKRILLKMPSPNPPKRTVKGRLRTYLLTGIVVAAPLVISGSVVVWLIRMVDNLVRPLLPAPMAAIAIPGFGLVLAVVSLILLGAVTANVAGRYLLRIGDEVFSRVPLLGNLYRPVRQVFDTLVKPGARSFREVVLVEYPRQGAWVLGFVTGPAPAASGENMLSLFIPTSPNLYAGILIFVPRENTKPSGLSVDEAVTFQLSMGLAQS